MRFAEADQLTARDATLSGEWRLHKAKLAQTGHFPAVVAFGMIAEFVARRVETWVFVFLAFDGARLASAWPLRDQIGGQSEEQFGPQLAALFLGAGLSHGLGGLAQGIGTC